MQDYSGRELGIELENFGSGLAHVAILKRNFGYLREDYLSLRQSYEEMAKELENLHKEFNKLKEEKADWK
jgi:FtsZ-binding cell division protein ZapB